MCVCVFVLGTTDTVGSYCLSRCLCLSSLSLSPVLLGGRFEGVGSVISYGPCQFPTLGFVAERFKKRQNFVAREFWGIQVKHTKVDKTLVMWRLRCGCNFSQLAFLVVCKRTLKLGFLSADANAAGPTDRTGKNN